RRPRPGPGHPGGRAHRDRPAQPPDRGGTRAGRGAVPHRPRRGRGARRRRDRPDRRRRPMTESDAATIPAGAATGIGSMPGTDPLEAARLIAGELEELPHLVELPDRGLGADLIGRTAGMLVDLPVDTSTTG